MIPYLYVDQWGVKYNLIYQPSMLIHNHPIHYYYMDHKSNIVFSSIFQLFHCLIFKLNGIHKFLGLFCIHTTMIYLHQLPPKNIYVRSSRVLVPSPITEEHHSIMDFTSQMREAVVKLISFLHNALFMHVFTP
jgi:hypothetical protein